MLFQSQLREGPDVLIDRHQLRPQRVQILDHVDFEGREYERGFFAAAIAGGRPAKHEGGKE